MIVVVVMVVMPTGSCAASACSLVLQVAMTMVPVLPDGSSGGTVEGKLSSVAESRSTTQHGRAGSRTAEGRDRRRREPSHQRQSAGQTGSSGNKRKVSPPNNRSSGEGKAVTGEGGPTTTATAMLGKSGGSMPVSKNVSYAEVLKTMRSAEGVALGGKVSSRCQTPSDTSSPSLSRKTPGGMSTPEATSGGGGGGGGACSPSAASESSKRGRLMGSSPVRGLPLQNPSVTGSEVLDGEVAYESCSTLDDDGTEQFRDTHRDAPSLEAASLDSAKEIGDKQHQTASQPRTPVVQLPPSPRDLSLTPENKSSNKVPDHSTTVSPGKPSTPLGQTVSSPVQKAVSQDSAIPGNQSLTSNPPTITDQPSAPTSAASVQSQAGPIQNVTADRSNVSSSSPSTNATTEPLSSNKFCEEPAGGVVKSHSVPMVTKSSSHSSPSDGILAAAPDKIPLGLPPGLTNATPFFPHMISAASVSKQYPGAPTHSLSGLTQQPSLLPPAIPVSRHPPPNLPQQPPMLSLDKMTIAHQQPHLHGHSLPGPPIPFNPQTTATNSSHPRPLIPGQPQLTQQQYELLLSFLQHQHHQQQQQQQQQQHQQQQALHKAIMLQHLSKLPLDKMEHQQQPPPHNLFLDPAKTGQLQQRPQQLYQSPLTSVPGKVEVTPARATMQPYLMHSHPQNPVSQMAWSHHGHPPAAPVYPPHSVPTNYGPVAVAHQRPPIVMPAEAPPSGPLTMSESAVKREHTQPSLELSEPSAPVEGDAEDRETNGDSLKSSNLSIKATPFVPKSRTLPASTVPPVAAIAPAPLPRVSSDYNPQPKRASFPHQPQEVNPALRPMQGMEPHNQPLGQAPYPLGVPQTSLVYNSMPRIPPPGGASTMVVMPQMKVKPSTVAAGKKGRGDSQPYSILPDRGGLLQNTPLHRQLSGGNGSGLVGEKGVKDQMPMYRYPPLTHPGTDILGAVTGMDVAGRHHIHPVQKTAKGYHVPGHPAGALHSGKAIMPPSADAMLPGTGRSPIMSGGHPLRETALKSLHMAPTTTSKRALLPTPPPPRIPHPGSQPTWNSPLHPPAPPTTHSHILGRGGHPAGGPMLFPPDQSLAGIPPSGYGNTGPNPGILASLTATYTQNQV